jgi:flagellar biosynthesis/type III secretory pathway protein FliH
LEADSNPFAVVTMAHLQAQATSPDSANRRDAKFRLARRLYERGYTRQMILDLFRFIDWVLALTPARESEFEVALIAYEKEHSMQYITSIERRGREVGSREGIEQGLEQGQALGRLAAMREGIVKLLAMRFTAVPEEIVARLEAIVDPAGLRQRLRLAANIDSLTAFEQALTDFA